MDNIQCVHTKSAGWRTYGVNLTDLCRTYWAWPTITRTIGENEFPEV